MFKDPRAKFVEVVCLLIFGLSIFYFYAPISSEELDKVFLSTSSFLFAIFTGFFIQRQGNRYTTLREKLNAFDGEISSIYRNAGYFPGEMQVKFSSIILPYYERMARGEGADVVFGKQSSILSDTHALLKSEIHGKLDNSLESTALTRIETGLHQSQLIRKSYIALKEERVPWAQWILIYVITIVLIATISVVIPSEGVLLAALLKAAFVSAIVFVLILLYQLDNLKLFQSTIGQSSAQDVVSIIKK